MPNKSPKSLSFSVALIPAIALAAPALGQVSLSGESFQREASADRGGRILVGFEGVGSATISGGVVVELESALLPPDPPDDRATVIATSPFFLVGENPGGVGNAVVEGEGTSVVLRGNGNAPTVHAGNRGASGTLEIRDGASVRILELATGAPSVPNLGTSFFVGARGGGTGTLVVDDASAEVISTIGAFMSIGDRGATGNATFRNGASLTLTGILSDEAGGGAGIFVGRDPADASDPDYEGGSGGTGNLFIDGSTASVTSANATAQLVVGREGGTTGTTQVTNGSRIDLVGATSLLDIGREGDSLGTMTMDGGSQMNLDGVQSIVNIGQQGGAVGSLTMRGGSQINLDGAQTFVNIGQQAGAVGSLTMTEGAVLGLNGTDQATFLVGAAFPDFGRDEGGTGTLVMSGAGTRLDVNGNMIVGAPVDFGGGTGSGVASVSSGATLQAGTVFVGAGGVLTGDGGIIDADVTLDGGVITPGLSPGSMSILGDLTARTGIFDFEFAGSGPGLYDTLDIFGDFDIGADVTFRFSFLDGFMPADDTDFSFLNVGGALSGEVSNVVFDGIADSSGLSLFTRDGAFVLAQSDPRPGDGDGGSVAPIPLPASALLLASGAAALAVLRRRRTEPA